MRVGTVLCAFVLGAIAPGLTARADADPIPPGWKAFSDPTKPREISRLDFSPLFINAGSQSLHSALPLWVVPAQMVQKHSQAR